MVAMAAVAGAGARAQPCARGGRRQARCTGTSVSGGLGSAGGLADGKVHGDSLHGSRFLRGSSLFGATVRPSRVGGCLRPLSVEQQRNPWRAEAPPTVCRAAYGRSPGGLDPWSMVKAALSLARWVLVVLAWFGIGFRRHRIGYGDTLSSIALRYGSSVRMIAIANKIPNPDFIRAGDTLIIP